MNLENNLDIVSHPHNHHFSKKATREDSAELCSLLREIATGTQDMLKNRRTIKRTLSLLCPSWADKVGSPLKNVPTKAGSW